MARKVSKRRNDDFCYKENNNVFLENNLTIDDVNKWLDNFSGRVYCPDDEKKMALWMLCNFTYYNENEINHLCRMIYKNLLHDIAQRDGLDSNEKLADAFKNIYFAAMGNAGESGGLLLYFLGRNRGLVWIDFVIHLLYLMMKQKR